LFKMGKPLTDLLTAYLYKNGYLSLPNLGHFKIVGEEDLSQPEKIDFNKIPNDFIKFEYDPKEDTDMELIKYIMAHTRKMQSLATADLMSFTDQAFQMLNILQPVDFAGIGKIIKDSKGKVEYTTGMYLPEVLDDYN